MLALPQAGNAAEEYPTKPIRLIIPSSPGSGVDPAARVIGEALTKLWGQRIVIENRGGAANTIGYNVVADEEPDGYTVLFSTGTLALSPAVIKDLPYDAHKDFTAITMVASLPISLVASKATPVNNIPELIAYAKSNPGKLSFGSGGEGTTNDLVAAMFAQKADIQILQVPFNGAANALTSLMGNEINFVFSSTATTLPFIQDGTARAMAVTTAKRQPVLPDTPTIMETVPGFDVSNWYAIFAPAGLPPEVLARWTEALAKVKQDPDVQKFFTNVGAVLELSTPEVMDARLHSDLDLWQDIVSHLPKSAAK